MVAFENHFTMRTNGLSITKEVSKEYENDILPDRPFTFTVNITGEGIPEGASYPYTIEGGTGGTVAANGGTIPLKGGQTAWIEGIPAGASYTVTETADEDYRTYIDETETNKAEGTISAEGSASVTFTNIYKRHLADLTITKAGWESIDENQSFVFLVKGKGVELTVVIHGTDSATIKDLPIGDYTVTEDSGWSWRYSGEGAKTVGVTVGRENTAAFQNVRASEPDKSGDWRWLNGCAWCDNRWIDGIRHDGKY